MAKNKQITIPSGQYNTGKKKYDLIKDIVVDDGEKGYKQLAAYLKSAFDDVGEYDSANIIIQVKNATKDLIKKRKSDSDEIAKMFADIKKEMSEALKEIIDLTGKTEKKIAETFGKKISNVKTETNNIVKSIDDAGNKIEQSSSNMVKTISKTLDNAVNNTVETANNMIDNVKEAVGVNENTNKNGAGKGSGNKKTKSKNGKTKDITTTIDKSIDKLSNAIDTNNSNAEKVIEKKVDTVSKEIKKDTEDTKNSVVNAIDKVKNSSIKANKESVILAGKYNLTSKKSVDIPKNIKLNSSTSNDDLRKYLESFFKEGEKITDNQIKTLKTEANKRLKTQKDNGDIETIVKNAVGLDEAIKGNIVKPQVNNSNVKANNKTVNAINKLAEDKKNSEVAVNNEVKKVIEKATTVINKEKEKKIDNARQAGKTIISAGKYDLVGGRKNGSVNIEKDLIISSGDKGISELQEYLMTVVTGANKVTKTQTKNLRSESNKILTDRISSLSSNGSNSTDVKNEIYGNAISYDRAIKDWFAKEMAEDEKPLVKTTTPISNVKTLSKEEKEILDNRQVELNSAKNGQQLSLGVPVAKKPNNLTTVVEEVKEEVKVEELKSPIGPQGSFDYSKLAKEYRDKVKAKEIEHKKEQLAIGQERIEKWKEEQDQYSLEQAEKEAHKINDKMNAKKLKSLREAADKIAKKEAKNSANTTEEEKNVGAVSRASTSYSFADIKKAMESLKDVNTLEPNRRIDSYHIKEYDEIADAKKRERAQRDVKSSTASNYIGGPGAVTSREVINGMLHRADPSMNKKTREAIMNKESHRLDLEYAPQAYIDKLETFTKTSVNDPDFLEKTYELRNKDKKIGKEMNDMHEKIQKNFENVHIKRLEERNRELANVKYGIHVGSVVTPGKNQNGEGKTTKSPILFRSEKELEDYLRSINPKASQDTLNKIKEKVMKEYNDDFKNVYKNEIDAGRNIYGLDEDIARKDVRFNDLMSVQDSKESSQFDKIKNYSGASDDIITEALMDREDKAIASEENVQKVRTDNAKNNAKKSNEEDRKEEERSKKRQKNKANETQLQKLYNEATKKNVDLQLLGEKALIHQKVVHQEILKINEKLNNLKRKEAQEKKQYVDILMREKSTAEEKLAAEEKLKEIGKYYKAQRSPYEEALKSKKSELEQNKELLDQGIRNHLKSKGAKEGDINRLMDSATRSRRNSAGGSGGSGGNGGGGVYINGGDIIFPVSQNTVDENKSRLATMYNDFTSTYGKIRSGMYMFSQFSATVEGLAKIEEAVYDLGVVGQLSTVEISSLRKELLYTATQGRYTTIELAESAADIVRTGRSFEESMEILKQSQILATASFDNVRNSTNTLIKAMTAFNLNASSAAHAANSFHNVVNATPLDLKTFDDSLRQTSAAFGSMVYFSSKSGTALEEYKKQVVDTTAVLTGLQAILGRTGSQSGSSALIMREHYNESGYIGEVL